MNDQLESLMKENENRLAYQQQDLEIERKNLTTRYQNKMTEL